MAPRRRAPRRARKPSMAAAKKMVTKQHKAKAKRNMDTFFLKARSVENIVPTQGATVANYIYRAYTLDPGLGPGPGLFVNNAEFNLYRIQYDKYRVNSVTVKVTPKANVLDQANANMDGTLNVTGDGVVHSVIDRDSGGPSSVAGLSRYPSYKKHSILKPFTRSYSVRYPTGVWIDCQNQATFDTGKSLGLLGGVTFYAENVLEDNYEIYNEPWAQVEITYNIVFQGKTSSSLTGVYDGGDLVGITITGLKPEDNKPFSPAANVRGSLEDTRTVDEVTEVVITDRPDA